MHDGFYSFYVPHYPSATTNEAEFRPWVLSQPTGRLRTASWSALTTRDRKASLA
jgi:hypothetical protein